MTSQSLRTKEGDWLSRSLFSEFPRDPCPWLDTQNTHYRSLSPSSLVFSGPVVFNWGSLPRRVHLVMSGDILGCQNWGGGPFFEQRRGMPLANHHAQDSPL